MQAEIRICMISRLRMDPKPPKKIEQLKRA